MTCETTRPTGTTSATHWLRRIAALGIAAGAALSLAACGGLSASSSCADFNAASADEQVSVVQELFHRAHPDYPVNGPATTNAVFNVTYECGAAPSRQLGQLGDFSS